MFYIQLLYWKVIKNDKTFNIQTLTNFPRNHNVSALFPQLRSLDNIKNLEFQQKLIGSIKINQDLLNTLSI